eukprot:361613-Chlamydomonas_euryale.AAC.3
METQIAACKHQGYPHTCACRSMRPGIPCMHMSQSKRIACSPTHAHEPAEAYRLLSHART